jgi:hypothetical protein
LNFSPLPPRAQRTRIAERRNDPQSARIPQCARMELGVMTDTSVHHPAERSHAGTRLWRVPARLARAIDRTLFAHRIRRDLSELPERLRRDIGLTRM